MRDDTSDRKSRVDAGPKEARRGKLSLDWLATWCEIELPCFQGLEVLNIEENNQSAVQ
jgi:hypothetical protein